MILENIQDRVFKEKRIENSIYSMTAITLKINA